MKNTMKYKGRAPSLMNQVPLGWLPLPFLRCLATKWHAPVLCTRHSSCRPKIGLSCLVQFVATLLALQWLTNFIEKQVWSLVRNISRHEFNFLTQHSFSSKSTWESPCDRMSWAGTTGRHGREPPVSHSSGPQAGFPGTDTGVWVFHWAQINQVRKYVEVLVSST